MRFDVTFPKISEATRLQRLRPPTRRVRMVLDTDTYNETDDQFAVVHALLSPERLAVEAIYAAPFYNQRCDGPGHGMELSYQEILRLLERLGRSPDGFAFRGSTGYLDPGGEPRASAAVRDLIARGLASPADDPLYVVAIGAITNVASALLTAPALAEKIVVVWLAATPSTGPIPTSSTCARTRRLPHPARLRRALVLIPCMGVTSHLRTSVPEIERHVEPHGALGAFLASRFKELRDDHFAWSRGAVGRGDHRLPARPGLGADGAGVQSGADRSIHLERRPPPSPDPLRQLRPSRPDLPRSVP